MNKRAHIFILFCILLLNGSVISFNRTITFKNNLKKNHSKDVGGSFCYPEYYKVVGGGNSCFQRCKNEGLTNARCSNQCCFCTYKCMDVCMLNINYTDEIFCINACCHVMFAHDNPPYK